MIHATLWEKSVDAFSLLLSILFLTPVVIVAIVVMIIKRMSIWVGLKTK